jgi:hypothetical protein
MMCPQIRALAGEAPLENLSLSRPHNLRPLSDYNLNHLTKPKSKFETWFATIPKIPYY